MNDIFDWTRFCKVVRKDIMNIWPRAGKLMLLMAAVPVACWLLVTVSSIDRIMSPESRVPVIFGVIFLFGLFFPSTMYYSCNRPKQGVYFAMLPASHLEKYLSMLLNCFVIAPLMLLVGIVLCDTILTLIPFGPYHKTLFSALQVVEIPVGDDFPEGVSGHFMLTFVRKIMAFAVLGVLLHQMIFIFSNTVFKSHKFIFTVLSLWCIQFLSQIIMLPIFIHSRKIYGFMELTENNAWGLLDNMLTVAIIICVLLIGLLVWWTGYRLKKMRY